MPNGYKTTDGRGQADATSGLTMPDAIAAVRRALVLRTHLRDAGADREFDDATVIVTHWVMRVVAAAVGSKKDIARKRDLIVTLDRYGFTLPVHLRAMADAVLAHEAAMSAPRPSRPGCCSQPKGSSRRVRHPRNCTTATEIEDDEIRTAPITPIDAARQDSRLVAAEVDVHLSPLSERGFEELLAVAEATDDAFEVRVARGDLEGALQLGPSLEHLALRVACGTPHEWPDMARRIRLLGRIRSGLPVGGALSIMLGVVIEADRGDRSVAVADRPPAVSSLH